MVVGPSRTHPIAHLLRFSADTTPEAMDLIRTCTAHIGRGRNHRITVTTTWQIGHETRDNKNSKVTFGKALERIDTIDAAEDASMYTQFQKRS